MKEISQIRLDLQAVHKINKMVSIELMGGLGNWMFQIAFYEYLKTITNSEINLYIGSTSPHSNTDLMNTVFENWKDNLTEYPHNMTRFIEENLRPYNWKDVIETNSDIHIIGYFQNYTYLTPNLLQKLKFPIEIMEKYPNIRDKVFLHIRGGDYLNGDLYEMKLHRNYYPNAIKEFPNDTQFYIFTNDMNYAKSMLFLNNIAHEFIQESDLDSLYLMSQCKGGICANSSFSWWGARLNPTRKLTLPSKWFNDPSYYTDGYYFKEATIIEI